MAKTKIMFSILFGVIVLISIAVISGILIYFVFTSNLTEQQVINDQTEYLEEVYRSILGSEIIPPDLQDSINNAVLGYVKLMTDACEQASGEVLYLKGDTKSNILSISGAYFNEDPEFPTYNGADVFCKIGDDIVGADELLDSSIDFDYQRIICEDEIKEAINSGKHSLCSNFVECSEVEKYENKCHESICRTEFESINEQGLCEQIDNKFQCSNYRNTFVIRTGRGNTQSRTSVNLFDSCIIDRAIRNNDPNGCYDVSEIPESPTFECVKRISLNTQNPDLCLDIDVESQKDSCCFQYYWSLSHVDSEGNPLTSPRANFCKENAECAISTEKLESQQCSKYGVRFCTFPSTIDEVKDYIISNPSIKIENEDTTITHDGFGCFSILSNSRFDYNDVTSHSIRKDRTHVFSRGEMILWCGPGQSILSATSLEEADKYLSSFCPF